MAPKNIFEKVWSWFLGVWNRVLDQLHVWKLGKNIPGDPTIPIFGNVFYPLTPTSQGITDYAILLADKIGKLFRIYIGPLLVIVSTNHKDDEQMLSGYDHMNKGLLYSFLKPWLGDGLLISTGEKWRKRRKILTPAFHFNILEQFIPVFNSCGDEFIRQMRKRSGGEAFDVWIPVKLLTLDIICETTMGVKMNAQTNSKTEYVHAVNNISSLIYEWVLRPWLYPNFIFRFTNLGRRFKACIDVLHSTTNKIIQERRAEMQKMESYNTTMDIDELGRRRRVAFLDLLLLAARDGSLTDEDIREEVDTFMFEGHDTTASGISFTLYLLAQHDDVQTKILQELEEVFDVSKPFNPSLSQLSELPYTEMVIKESMRLYPPVASIGRDLSHDMTLNSNKKVLPKGASFFMSIYLLHRDAEMFPDPETFDPERFSPDECARRHPFAYLPFSAGPRNCIGQRFAILEMKNIIAKVIWNFRLLPLPNFTLQLNSELVTKSMNGLFLKVEERRL